MEEDLVSKLLRQLQLSTDNEPVENPLDVKTKWVPQVPTTEDINDELKERFLNPSNELPWDLLDVIQDIPEHSNKDMFDSLIMLPESIKRSSFRSKRRGISGEVVSFKEELNTQELINSNSANSISLNRSIGNSNSIKGDTSQLPFKPGGLNLQSNNSNTAKDQTKLLPRDEHGLFNVPNGLSRGLKLSIGSSEDLNELEEEHQEEDGFDDIANKIEEVADKSVISLSTIQQQASANAVTPSDLMDIDELLPMDMNFSRNLVSTKNSQNDLMTSKKVWAHMVDLNHKIENFDELIPQMARTWPFELDTFQQEAVYHLEQGDSVFVAAHTSAGKTVIAEYAIAMANRNMTKAIYTSPIKALSNQKFRDFKETFKELDVGLITGDVQINPEANCLIMTTEILRSMLYRGSDVIRDVEFVIFDEVHYVNDIDRGVVWEEVIIMLPDHVKFILLSATVPNTFEFANWVGRTKQKDIYVISTPKRPVPLEISLWGKGKLWKVIDATRKFDDVNFNKYKEVFEPKKIESKNDNSGRGGRGGGARGGARGSTNGRGGGGRGGSSNNGGGGGRGGSSNGGGFNRFSRSSPNKNTWIELVQFLNSNTLLPAVIFVFSKKRCEEYASTLTSIDFCNAKEKNQIHVTIEHAVARLKKEDRELPQILAVRDMLMRGIAIHHGGLLPIVKEVIEILFAKTLVKVLFATETFAMGLNLPTRTVVFQELRKHDGTGFRNLLPGEFTQMSGRAGRRGLDKTGTVIVMSYTEALSAPTLKEVMLGTPTKLVSQFRLTYNMILNLLRIEALKVEEMIKHSFSENTTQTLLPQHQQEIKLLEESFDQVPDLAITEDPFTPEDVQKVFELLNKYKDITKQLISEAYDNQVLHKNFRTGRLVVFKDLHKVTRIGFIAKDQRNTKELSILGFNIGAAEFEKPSDLPFITTLEGLVKSNFTKITYGGELDIYTVPLTNVEIVVRLQTKCSINEIIKSNQTVIDELKRQIQMFLRFQSKLEELDFKQFGSLKIHELLEARDAITNELGSNFKHVYTSPNFKDYYVNLNEKFQIQTKIDYLRSLVSDENLELLPDYEQRLQVLRHMEFVDDKLNVGLKGRVACEINCGWELAITELVLNNFLGDYEPEEIVALLSAFVYEGRTSDDEDPKITPRLEKGKAKICEIMGTILQVFDQYQVALTADEADFLERKRFALANVVYEWARGMTFKEIMELSVEQEGTIVRVITRLDEVCREVKSAALIIGDSVLHSKMSVAQEMIKRDIVFCASLYL